MNLKDMLHFGAKISIKIPGILETAKKISAWTRQFSLGTLAVNLKNGLLKKGTCNLNAASQLCVTTTL